MSSFNQQECLGCGQPCDGCHCYSCTCQQCEVILLNGICLNCIYGDGKPITCCECEGPLRGGFCLFCNSKAENSFTYDPNAYYFNGISSNFNHLPQPQYETYLYELCGNDSHYGYDCQPHFPFVYEHELRGLMRVFSVYQWTKIMILLHAQPEDINELLQKLLEDLQIINEELAKYINSPSWNRPTFYNDDEEHSIQYKEYLKNSSNAIAATYFNQEKKEPPQNSDIRQLIREECGTKVCEEKKKNMEDTMLELLKVCRQKELYCMHNDVDDLIEKSLQNFRVIHKKSSISLNNTSQISLVNAIAPVLPTEEPEYSLSMGDDTSSDNDAFEDIEYVEASLPDSERVSLEEENDVYQEEKEIALEDILQIQDVILREKLLSINHLIADIEFLNDNPTPDRMLNDHTEETRSGSTTAYANNSPLEYDSFCFKIEPDQGRLTSIVMNDIFDNSTNDPLLEEGYSFSEEFLSNDSISLPKNESSNFDHHDDLSFPRPPPEPPDVKVFFDFEPNSGELISAVMNNIDELNEDECFNPVGGEINVFANIEDDDYFPFIFVIRIFLPYLIYPEVSPLLLSIGSKDTIFEPGIST
nr:hypothetical protein [Tanacetum cinerariifolium]